MITRPDPISSSFSFDANGNLTNDGTNTYTWDTRNRLVGISGGIAASFAYDPLGRRASKTISGTTTQFLYDGNDIVTEFQGGSVTASYLRSLNIDELFGILRQDGVYFSIYDSLGSTLNITNQSGTSTVQYAYEPFGRTQSSLPTFTNPFQFTGRESDNTGLYYYRARYYNPIAQRFISEDPARFVGDYNLYAYVLNNPVNYVDPDGMIRLPPGIGGMPPRAPVQPSRPNIPNDPQLYRPLEPQQMPSGDQFIPKTPAWMRLLKRLAGDDGDLDVTMPGVVCINISRSAGVPVPLGGRKDGDGTGMAQGPNLPTRYCYFDDGAT